jgi:DNA-binding NtrC family response regulator
LPTLLERSDVQYHELGIILQASGYLAGRRLAGKNSQAFLDWLREANPDPEEQNGLFQSWTAEQLSGTLFLDEVATLPPKVMAGILRVLSTGEVRPFGYQGVGISSYCRIIAATNEVNVLKSSITDKQSELIRFRRDLCYRLGAILTLTPLRDRNAEDIQHYLEKVVWGQLKMPKMPVERAALDQIVKLYQERTDVVARQCHLLSDQ